MNTIYKAKAVGGTETITARVFSDGEEIHSEHPLYPRTTYQWYLDRLNGLVHEEITGATSNTYEVPLGDVSNSGEYYCKFTIGLTGCTIEYSPRTRISIVSCEGSVVTPNPVPWGGATNVQVTILHAKFETAVFSNEGLSWATYISTTPCTSCLSTTTTVASFSVAANSGANKARRGQVSLAVGGLKCYYNVVQDYQRTLAADGTEADPSTAPFIQLEHNGPTQGGGNVEVQAQIGVPGVDANGSTGDYTISWSSDYRLSTDSVTQKSVYTRADAGDVVVTATVTDNATLLTDSASVRIPFSAAPVVEEPRGLSGIIPSYASKWLSSHDILGGQLPHSVTQEFEVTGDGYFELYISISPKGLFPESASSWANVSDSQTFIIEITLTGPGAVNGSEIITFSTTGPDFANETYPFNGVGKYTATIRWLSSVPAYPTGGSMANAIFSVWADNSGIYDGLNWDALEDWVNDNV